MLRQLEELGVPIDCIAGTSIGAVVGGLYAAGYSPDQIESELLGIDWQALFRGSPARESLSFRRKSDDNRYLLGFELGFVDGRLATATSGVVPFELDFQLQRLALPALGVADFDRLTPPFRAVAADLETGERVAIGHGDLALALRASMSLPGVFPPVLLDERLLVDGGVVDNLPVDVVREMGAEIVIAVDVGAHLLATSELRSVAAITSQALAMALEQLTRVQADDADILIAPELEGIGPFAFEDLPGVIERGTSAARANAASLVVVASGRPPRSGLTATDRQLPEVEAIEIHGLQRVDEQLVRSRMRSRTSEPLDLALVHSDLGRIEQIGEFEFVRFALQPRAAGVALVISVSEKPWGPHYLRFGSRFVDDLAGSNSFGLLVNYTRTTLNALGGEWLTDLRLGEIRGLFTELYQPLDFAGHFFVAGSLETRRESIPLYVDGTRIAEYDLASGAIGLDLGTQLEKYGEIRFGLRWGEFRANPRAGAADLPSVEATVAGIQAGIVIDRLDSVSIPSDGSVGRLEAFHAEPALGADSAYTKVTGSYSRYFTRGSHTVFATLDAGTALDTELPVYAKFTRGGLQSFSGFRPDELRGDHFGLVRPGYLYRLFELPPGLGVAAYIGGWLEAGNVWAEREDIGIDELERSVTLAVGLDTRIGPIYFGYGYAGSDSGYFQLSVGRRF